MTACGTDYFDQSLSNRSYIVLYAIACYFLPLALIIYSYFFIVQVKNKNLKLFFNSIQHWSITFEGNKLFNLFFDS